MEVIMWNKTALEHVNMTVIDPDKTANMLCTLFGWNIRWKGPSKDNGYTVHVGSKKQYFALYRPQGDLSPSPSSYSLSGGLNHIGIEVKRLDPFVEKVRNLGYTPHHFGEYDPGRRFYFHDENGIEYEIVSYRPKSREWKLWSGMALASLVK